MIEIGPGPMFSLVLGGLRGGNVYCQCRSTCHGLRNLPRALSCFRVLPRITKDSLCERKDLNSVLPSSDTTSLIKVILGLDGEPMARMPQMACGDLSVGTHAKDPVSLSLQHRVCQNS